MLTSCANPDCATPFHHFNEGRLFRFDLPQAGPGSLRGYAGSAGLRAEPDGSAAPQQLFWLCARCSRTRTCR